LLVIYRPDEGEVRLGAGKSCEKIGGCRFFHSSNALRFRTNLPWPQGYVLLRADQKILK
jgi:hypothetical protein